jgi:hypothetical protein
MLVLNKFKSDNIEENIEISNIDSSIVNNDSVKDTLDLELDNYFKNNDLNRSIYHIT